jgi:hypothetical protein
MTGNIRQPIGVVAGIVPWNFSLMIGVWKIGSALTTGCTIVLKPCIFFTLHRRNRRLHGLTINFSCPTRKIS